MYEVVTIKFSTGEEATYLVSQYEFADIEKLALISKDAEELDERLVEQSVEASRVDVRTIEVRVYDEDEDELDPYAIPDELDDEA